LAEGRKSRICATESFKFEEAQQNQLSTNEKKQNGQVPDSLSVCRPDQTCKRETYD
jgi:hypothetical protein